MAKLTPEDVVAALVARGVPLHVAQGVVMNFQDESGLNTGIQERAPTSGRGGFGLAQWTGPRRIALEDYARLQRKSVDDPDVQLDFFMQENQGPEAAAWKAVMSAPTAQDAAVAFVNKWERPASQYALERSSRYMGTSPSEARGTRFGGTGLGIPLNPADSPSEGGSRFGGTGLGTPATATATKKKGFDWDKFAAGFGDAAMGGGQAAMPYQSQPAPKAAVASAPAAPMVNPEMQQMQRDRLAQALAMLQGGGYGQVQR